MKGAQLMRITVNLVTREQTQKNHVLRIQNNFNGFLFLLRVNLSNNFFSKITGKIARFRKEMNWLGHTEFLGKNVNYNLEHVKRKQ